MHQWDGEKLDDFPLVKTPVPKMSHKRPAGDGVGISEPRDAWRGNIAPLVAIAWSVGAATADRGQMAWEYRSSEKLRGNIGK